MGKYYFIIIFFYLGTVTQAQHTIELDSLVNLLKNAKEDTNKVNILLAIEREYLNLNLDSALHYNTICKDLISRIGAQEYMHQCLHDFVKIYHARAEFEDALNYCLKSIQVARENKNKFEEAASYRAIFNIYHNLNMNDSSVKYAVHSVKLTTEIGDTANIAVNYGNLCWLYLDFQQYDRAVDYGRKGIESGEHYADTVGLLVSINNLALCYLRMNIYDKAIDLLKKQYEIGKRVNRRRSIRNALVNLGMAYYYVGDGVSLDKTTTLLNKYNSGDTTLSEANECHQYITNAYNYILQKKFQLA